MQKVATLGEILVEILASDRGQSFRGPGPLSGPFPSGAPAIFIDQVARLGQPCGMIGCVGDDDFGTLNVERLRADGVDVSAIAVSPTRPTGTAFVTYEVSGDRHFIFNIAHSASGELALNEAAERLLAGSDHLHVMGTSLFSPRLVQVALDAAATVKAKGGTVSFDPNLRRELASGSWLADSFRRIVAQADVLLPSGPELRLITGAETEAAAIATLLDGGTTAIAVKRGADGASFYDGNGAVHARPIRVTEVDPTGAGDCFGAAFVVCWLRGFAPADALRYANACGARKVTFRGPMEGVATFADLDAWLAGRVAP
jgi:sugar/nucleoside kinase (ribokinase family)